MVRDPTGAHQSDCNELNITPFALNFEKLIQLHFVEYGVFLVQWLPFYFMIIVQTAVLSFDNHACLAPVVSGILEK